MTRKHNTSIIEEVFNAITHGMGVVLGVAALIILIKVAENKNDVLKNVGYIVFGISVIVAYLSSTLYHCLFFTGARKVFRILDHSSIFLLIAGTYTPFTLTALRGHHGTALLIIIWFIAISGIILKSFFIHRFMKVSLVLYVLMGWLIVFETKPLLSALPLPAVLFLMSGGIFYTAGIAFYLSRKMPFHHVIWHVFVLTGSVFHFLALLYL